MRWLDTAEQHAWRSLVVGVTLLVDRLDSDLRREHRLTFDEFAVLAVIAEHTAGISIEDLGQAHTVQRNRLTPLLARMQVAGWIRREGEGPQQPGCRIMVTLEGLDLLRSAAARHVTGIREYFLDHLDPEDFHGMARAIRRTSSVLVNVQRD